MSELSDQMADDRKAEAKRLCVDEGWTQDAVATHLGVTRRTIERWASEGGWGARKQAQKVVSIGEAKSKTQPSKPQPVNNPNPTPTREPVRVRRRDRGTIDELDLIETALCDVSTGMQTASSEDLRSLGTLAGALVKLLEYRRKIQPPTAAELAEQAIALGMSPAEFARELRQAWEKRA